MLADIKARYKGRTLLTQRRSLDMIGGSSLVPPKIVFCIGEDLLNVKLGLLVQIFLLETCIIQACQ